MRYVIAGGRAERDAARRDELTPPFGYFLLAVLIIFCVGALYAIVLSKLMPDTGHWLLDAIKHDHYYCYLGPACIPATVIFIYFNWLSLKFFRLN